MSQISVDQIVDVNGGNAVQINGMTPTAESMQGFRNRIINGDMRIDQRNAGASIEVTSNVQQFCSDRFQLQCAVDGRFTAQQDTSAPVGFNRSLKLTVTVADTSLSAGQVARVRHKIEGFNTADLSWGTANAQTVVLSFWVRSSLVGTFSAYATNSAANRSYPFTYNISVANTWEKKTVVIAGDTTGTWLNNNGIGIEIGFVLGAASSLEGTSSTWAAGEYYSVSGAVNLMATNGATFYITGVQLEAGSVATPFERRPYGTELALCQRYYEQSDGNLEFGATLNVITGSIPYIVQKRATPTFVFTDAVGNVSRVTLETTNNVVVSGGGIGTSGDRYARCRAAITGAGTGSYVVWRYTANAEL